MNDRAFCLLLATLTFLWTLKTGNAAVQSIQPLVPSKATRDLTENERLKMAYRCPPLDPCKIGDYYMDLYEKVRKGVNCPPQPQRCSTSTPITTTDAAVTVTQPTVAKPGSNPFVVLWCPYLKVDLGNKAFSQKYVDVLKALGCSTNSTKPVAPTQANVTDTTAIPDTADVTDSTAMPVKAGDTETTAMPARANLTDTPAIPARVNLTDTTVTPAQANVTYTKIIPGAVDVTDPTAIPVKADDMETTAVPGAADETFTTVRLPDETFTTVTPAQADETSATAMPARADLTVTTAIPVTADETYYTAMPVKANVVSGTTIAGAGAADGGSSGPAVRKSDLSTAISEAFKGMFRKFHF